MKQNKVPSKDQQQRAVRCSARQSTSVDFFNVLTGPELLELTEAHLPEHRERLYPPTVTLSMFIKQCLDEDGSCQRAVNGWAAQCVADGLSPQSVRTGAYCRARRRLPVEMVETLTRATGELLCSNARECWRWRGRRVKLIDGTGISMPDTPANQAVYPQPDSQRQGVGFPVSRIVGVICLATGGALDIAMAPYAGKGSGEQALARKLLGAFAAGDVMLADALYCSYWLIAALQDAGVDVVLQQNGVRITDFRRGERIGARDHIVRWRKPQTCPDWMTREEYAAFPAELRVRELKARNRVLVTTILEPTKARKAELADLYDQRWQVELDFRNIKTTLGMEVLSCKTPEMVEKELWVHLLAYNLIRLLMAQAALRSGRHPRSMSFKHATQLWLQWTVLHRGKGTDWGRGELLSMVSQISVGGGPPPPPPRARDPRACVPSSRPWRA
jgi:hypothetical protein